MRKIYVAGVGETPMGKYPDRSLKEMVSVAGKRALLDAGVGKGEIQALFFSNFNGSFLCGQSHMGPLVSETLGLGGVPTIRVEGACASGSIAFRQACIAVQAGVFDTVLVGGAEKMTHRETETVTSAIASAGDYEGEVRAGVTFPSVFAMIANRYGHEYGDPREAMAVCAVQNHENALEHPDAQMRKRITVEQVRQGVPIAFPLTIFDCSLVTDGAAFCVVTASESAARNSGKRIVEVTGAGHAGDTLSLASKKSLTTLGVTVEAARQAYGMAGLGPTDIDFAEVHDCFTITQILNIEDLGFFEKGAGTAVVLDGRTARTGRIPVNVSGGLKAKGHPIGATGLSQIHEAVTQIRGEAGARQLGKADIGLTHNIGGAAATCLVHIFTGR